VRVSQTLLRSTNVKDAQTFRDIVQVFEFQGSLMFSGQHMLTPQTNLRILSPKQMKGKTNANQGWNSV